MIIEQGELVKCHAYTLWRVAGLLYHFYVELSDRICTITLGDI